MKLLVWVLISCFGQTWASCHPQVDLLRPQFVLGYGSLIYEPSKQKTIPKGGKNHPILLKGFERAWLVRGYFLERPTTFLGVLPKSHSWMNAVVFQVHQLSDLKRLDQRERGYCRGRVAPEKIKGLAGFVPPHAEYWIYLPQRKIIRYANRHYPMSIYYANIFLTGCLDIARSYHLPNFLQQCVLTTAAWPHDYDNKYPKDALKVSKTLFARVSRVFLDHRWHKADELQKPNNGRQKTNANIQQDN